MAKSDSVLNVRRPKILKKMKGSASKMPLCRAEVSTKDSSNQPRSKMQFLK